MEFPISEWLWPNVPSLLVSLFTLIALFVIFKLFLFNKVRNLVETRQSFVDSQIENAKNENANAQKASESASSLLHNAKIEASTIISDSKSKALKEAEVIVGNANKEAARLASENREMIKQEKEALKGEIQKEIASVAMSAAKKIVEKEISEQDNKKLIDEFIKEVSS